MYREQRKCCYNQLLLWKLFGVGDFIIRAAGWEGELGRVEGGGGVWEGGGDAGTGDWTMQDETHSNNSNDAAESDSNNSNNKGPW